ncbi:MAG: hypothetical protein QXH91_04165, partial [Candidatus Bathyarchaeia archaeon]
EAYDGDADSYNNYYGCEEEELETEILRVSDVLYDYCEDLETFYRVVMDAAHTVVGWYKDCWCGHTVEELAKMEREEVEIALADLEPTDRDDVLALIKSKRREKAHEKIKDR